MRRHNARSCGVTLVETVVAAAGTAILIGLVSAGMGKTFSVARSNVVENDLERRGISAIDNITSDLMDAESTSIATPLAAPTGSSTITFQRRIGWANGEMTLGPEITIAWVQDPDDPADGNDNDGDGLIDEGDVIRTTGNESVHLAMNVPALLQGEYDNDQDDNGNGLEDERGLSFDLDGATLTVRLTLQREDGDGECMLHTSKSVVDLSE